MHSTINRADAFLFIISAESVKSHPCNEEIDYAVNNHKRLVPVVRVGVPDQDVRAELRQIQYIFLRPEDDFDLGLKRLIKSINSDLVWVQTHTYFLERALDWNVKAKSEDLLLRGVDLQEAEDWLAVAGTDGTKEPRPTELQTDYIAASRKQLLREQQDRTKSLRRWTTLLALALVVAVGAAIFAFYQLNVANARRSAATALSIMTSGYDRALLLCADAYAQHKDAETLGSLMTAMQRNARLVNFLHGSRGETWSLVYSPDGKMMASAHGDGTILLWNTVDYTLIGQPLRGHSKAVKSVAFSPDGKTLASASEDKTIILWDVQLGQQLGVLSGHEKEVQDVAFSPDGKTLASASNDEKVMLWNVATLSRVATLTGHSNAVRCVEFSPDGTLLASGSADDTIILWDARTFEEIKSLEEHTNTIWDVSFSPDGLMLASISADKDIILWDVRSGKSLGGYLSAHSNTVTHVPFSRDGKYLASSGADNTVRLWNVSKHSLEDTLSGHAVQLNCVAFSADGNTLVSGARSTRHGCAAGHC